MEISFFLKGLILGFSIAAPVGPIGILCIRRTLQFGRFSGLVSGLGATFADVIYATAAAFGLNFISDTIMASEYWLRLIGGIFLILLGLKTFFTKASIQVTVLHTTLINDFFSTFMLTLTNPLTILAFFAVFAGLGLSSVEGNYQETFMLILGVLLGSAAWWLLLSEGVTLFRSKVSQKVMQWINRIAGLAIILFGLATLFTLYL